MLRNGSRVAGSFQSADICAFSRLPLPGRCPSQHLEGVGEEPEDRHGSDSSRGTVLEDSTGMRGACLVGSAASWRQSAVHLKVLF